MQWLEAGEKNGDSYTKAESESRYQPKGNYTPAGQAYTKGESDARYQFQKNTRLACCKWMVQRYNYRNDLSMGKEPFICCWQYNSHISYSNFQMPV